MTVRNDAYWDELGVAWCAINPQPLVIAPKLRSRLRRQSLSIMAGLIAGFLLGGAGILLGVFTIWSGWGTGTWNFVIRGVAIMATSAIILIGAVRLLPVRADEVASTLSDMIDFSILRAQRTLLMIRLGYVTCAIASVFGLAGTAIRTHFTGPPKLSPIVDLAIVLVFALGLHVYGRCIKADFRKMYALRHALAMDDKS